MTTRRGRPRLRIGAATAGDRTQVVVTGRIPLGSRPVIVHRHPKHPGAYVAWSLITQLAQAGVTVTGGVKFGDLPGGVVELAAHESAPLDLVLHASNKDSNNYVAERIFEALGAAVFGGEPTPYKGREALTAYLTELGLPRGSFRAMNGSGLDHINRITPDALVGLLSYLYGHPRYGAEFVQSLAVAGIDGTISKRFRNAESIGLVRAKTGTLNRVSALSGYAGYNGRVVAFAILVEQFRPRALYNVRRAQVRMVETLMHYLRVEAGAKRPASPVEMAPSEGDLTGTPMDIESTTDPTVDLPQEPTPPTEVPATPSTPAAPPTPPSVPPPAEEMDGATKPNRFPGTPSLLDQNTPPHR